MCPWLPDFNKGDVMKTHATFFAVLLGVLTAFAQENYGTWPYYKNLTINTSASGANVTGNVFKVPILVRLSAADSVNKLRAENIRFTKVDGVTRLNHQIERLDSALQVAEVWVLLDTVYGNNSTQTIRMYWGKSGVSDSSNARAVFDTANGFQAVWHLGESTDSTVKDATVNNFSGTPATTGTGGNPFDTVGVIGRAKSFHVTTVASNAGTAGAYYTIPGTASSKLNFPEQSIYTLSAWVRPVDITNSGKIVSKGDRQYYLAKRNSGASYEFAENQTGSGQNWWRVNATANTWKYVVGVRTGGAGVAGGKEYVDAVVATTSGTSNNQATDRSFDVNIGRDPSQAGGAASYYLGAVIDEVTISNVARSPDWIKLSFETQKPGATAVVKGATIANAPNITSHPQNRIVNVGTSVKFGVSVSGTGPFTYKWVRRNVDTVGGNSDTLTIPSVVLADSGSYKVVVSNANGQSISNPAQLTVLPAGQEIYSSWAHYRDISVNTTPGAANVAGGVGKFPLLARLTSVQNDMFAQAGPNGTTIRFTKSDGVTRLSHQRERWDSVNKVAEFWVLTDSVQGNFDNRLRVYWGKSGAADSSNGAQVFNSANGFISVSHLGDAQGAHPRPNAVAGAPYASLRNYSNTYTAPEGIIALADTLRQQSDGTVNGNCTQPCGDDYIDLGRDSLNNNYNYFNLSTGSGFAVSQWVYDAGPVNVERLFSMANDSLTQAAAPTAGTGSRVLIMGNKANTGTGNPTNLSIRYTVAGTSITNFDGTSNTFTPNAWHHIVASKTSGSSAVNVYLDGSLYGSTVAGPGIGNVAHNYVWLGRTADANPNFKGKFDEVTVATQARSADWVKLSYETQKQGGSALVIGPTDGTIVGIGPAFTSHAAELSMTRTSKGYSFHIPGGMSRVALTVMDMSGRVLWNRTLNSDEHTVLWSGISGHAAGVYMVRLRGITVEGKSIMRSRTLAP